MAADETLTKGPETDPQSGLRIGLVGRFSVSGADGKNIRITSKRGQALLALLALAPSGVRERRWLQFKLWSTRGDKEGGASLRQCLSATRKALGVYDDVLISDRNSVGLDLDRVIIDVNELDSLLADNPLLAKSEFLEGLDIVDPEFEDWVRDQRSFWETRLEEVSRSRETPLKKEAALAPAPARKKGGTPVVVVLPFTVHGQNEFETHMVDGLFDEVIDQLARVRWLSVISRSSAIAGVTAGLTPLELGNKVGADYVISLDMYRSGSAEKLSVDLIRSSNMETVWHNTFTLPEKVTHAAVRTVAIKIAANVSNHVSRVTEVWSQGQPSDSNEVSEMLWRGRWHLHRLSKEDSRIARQLFEDVIEIDPGNAEAHLHLAWTLMWDAWANRAHKESIRAISALGQKAITLDNTDGRAFWIVGVVESWLRNFDLSNRYIDQAIELCPSLALAYSQKGSNCIYTGRPADALQWLEKSMQLSPLDTHRFFFLGEMAMAHMLNGDHSEALECAVQSLMLRRSYWYAHLIQTVSHWRSGDKAGAVDSYQRLMWHRPGLNDDFIRWLPFTDANLATEIIEDLRSISQQA